MFILISLTPLTVSLDYVKAKSYQGFPDSSVGKESACNAGDLGSIPGLGRSAAGGHGNPLQYSFLENPHGQRSLAGHSPWGCKESDTTEQLNTQYWWNGRLRAFEWKNPDIDPHIFGQ